MIQSASVIISLVCVEQKKFISKESVFSVKFKDAISVNMGTHSNVMHVIQTCT